MKHLQDPNKLWGLHEALTLAVGGGAGFMLAIALLMTCIREELEMYDGPKPLRDVGITLIMAGIMAMHGLYRSGQGHHECADDFAALGIKYADFRCGGCGLGGCSEYAEAVVKAETEVTLCAPGGAGGAARLAEIMGVTVSETFPYDYLRLQRTPYDGEPTCAAANLVSSVQVDLRLSGMCPSLLIGCHSQH